MPVAVSLKCQKWFFDREAVKRYVGAKNQQAFSKAGAFVRTKAKSSIRRRKAVSAPGQPPSAHAKSGEFRSLKSIWFAFDPKRGSVVVGPVGFNALSVFEGKLQPGRVPDVMEHGGTMGVVERMNRSGQWVRADFRSRRRWAGTPVRVRQAHYKPRPFMGPALASEMPKFPSLWAKVA